MARATVSMNIRPEDFLPTRRDLTRLGAFLATAVRERAFPGHGTGRDENDRPYKGYSTRPIYISKTAPPRPADMPKPRGGSPHKRKKRGKKTVFFAGGYRQYRAAIGRSTAKNLFLTGQTARGFNVLRVTPRRGGGTIVLGMIRRRERGLVLDQQYKWAGFTARELERGAELLEQIMEGKA